MLILITGFGVGSPPHTWRILSQLSADLALVGITSTYVENTLNIANALGTTEDHLHIRGEYGFIAGLITILVGSPPHTWRILQRTTRSRCYARITSTYVENTL